MRKGDATETLGAGCCVPCQQGLASKLGRSLSNSSKAVPGWAGGTSQTSRRCRKHCEASVKTASGGRSGGCSRAECGRGVSSVHFESLSSGARSLGGRGLSGSRLRLVPRSTCGHVAWKPWERRPYCRVDFSLGLDSELGLCLGAHPHSQGSSMLGEGARPSRQYPVIPLVSLQLSISRSPSSPKRCRPFAL